VLIFFQWTTVMDIMEDFLHYRDIKFCRLDGHTKAEVRQELLSTFNNPDSPYKVFLLSTRAGGLGLNLQSSDTVIMWVQLCRQDNHSTTRLTLPLHLIASIRITTLMLICKRKTGEFRIAYRPLVSILTIPHRRAHRIGQKKEVRVFRLVTSGTVEEGIIEVAKRKLALDGQIIQAGKFDGHTTAEERESFLVSAKLISGCVLIC
jgi:ATP-dependent helicase STH1/SNF2